MHLLRRLATPVVAISLLIGLSVVVMVSIGEGFKIFVFRKDSVRLKKRDGSTITFTLPWKSPVATDALTPMSPETKAVDPLGDLLGDVTNVAGAILGEGSNIASNVLGDGNNLVPTPAWSNPADALNGGADLASNVLNDVNSVVNQATSTIGDVIGDAMSLVGSILAGVTSPSNLGVFSSSPISLSKTSPSLAAATTSEPQEFLPQSAHQSSLPTSLSPVNITAVPSLSPSLPPSAPSVGFSCSPMIVFTSSYPAPATTTCTVTETWHSTHYAKTATLFSFMDVFTVTCTETVSVCPSFNPSISSPNTTSSPPLIACANGVLAKRQEDCSPSPSNISATEYPSGDQIPPYPCPNAGYSCSECPDGFFCPPQQTPAHSAPCGYGWICAHCLAGWYCIPGPTSNAANPVPSAAALLANTTSSPKVLPTAAASPSIPSSLASFTASLPRLSSIIATPPAASGVTGSITCVDGSLVVRTNDCLNGVLGATSSSLLAFRTTSVPALSQVTPEAGNAAGVGGNIISNVVAEVTSVLNNVQGLAGDLLSTVVADVTSVLAAVNGVTGGIIPTIIADAYNAAGNVPGHGETVVNGVPTVLPIVPTVLNGVPTTVPIVNMFVNSAPTDLPVVNNVGLFGGAGGVSLKGRRRGAKRDVEVVTVVDVSFCGQNPDHESCGW